MIRLLAIVLFACACFNLHAQVNIITTIAGNDTAGYCCDNGLGVNAKLKSPQTLCLDRLGNLYFTDAGNNRVRKISLATGIVTTIAGNGNPGYSGDDIPATNASLFIPTGIAVDSIGNVYIGDVLNNRVRKVNASTGIITTVVGNGIAGNSGDGGLAISAKVKAVVGMHIDKWGNMYIADSENETVRKINATTGIITTVAGNGIAGYAGDGGAATNASLSDPGQPFIDTMGNIILTDIEAHVIRKVDATTGIITTIAGNGLQGYFGNGGLAASSQMYQPYGLYVDKRNDIYFSEWGNGTIRKIDFTTNIITTVVGTGVQGFSGDDGPATHATMIPGGLCLDSNGTMYIADYGNNRIRKVYNPYLAVPVSKVTNDYELYPNPARDELTIEGAQNTTMVLSDVVGKVVIECKLNGTKERIDISSLNNGVYVVQVYDAVHNTRSMSKLVVAR